METEISSTSYKILEIDPWLVPFKNDINMRMEKYKATKAKLLKTCKTLSSYANGHLYYGFHRCDNGWYYREWAPNADGLWLTGDFNNWNRKTHPLTRIENGNWEVFIPGADSLKHLDKVKVIVSYHGNVKDKIPLYIRRCIQNKETNDFSGQIWSPDRQYNWICEDFKINPDKPLFIYEAHIGMSQEEETIGTYREFADNVLPRIYKNGYTAIQLMAIMQHPYYGSFGYHVSNFFAVSSWFGTPDDLKYLVDTAHRMGIAVLMDLVHSHAVKNTSEGINEFDGTTTQFFHGGSRGNHDAWDSKIFNYGKHEVIHFLLSNIKYWLEEYKFDGFRFDGVTSMIYLDHGLGSCFDSYKKYFDINTDIEALNYLQFANELIKELRPDSVTVAEDMSGMPGMCLPIKDGGIGFDYRLNMGVPDLWIKLLKEFSDEKWNVNKLWYELTTRRPAEKCISYAESHDQALVGDKTIFFRLADSELYWHMSLSDSSLIIDRAIALHKMIRFITLTLGGNGYLNFMGNEFGHPEWIDFPREGNNWSFKYCKRQWSLVDNQQLKYKYLYNFDVQMLYFVKSTKLLSIEKADNLWLDDKNLIICYKKGDYIFIFNFNPTESFPKFELQTNERGSYKVLFSSDREEFGGHNNIDESIIYNSTKLESRNNSDGIIIYTPSRTCMVLRRVN